MSIIRNENSNAQFYKDLIVSLNNEIWLSKRKTLIEKIKGNYSNIYKNYSDVIIYKSNSSLFKSLLKSFCEICVIGLMSYLVIKHSNLSIGKLTFVISAFALFTNSTSEISNYFLYKLEFDVYWQVYKDLTYVGCASENIKFELDNKINKISFLVDKYNYELVNNKTNLLKQPLIEIVKSSSSILINKKDIKDNQKFWESIIILNQQSKPNIDLLTKQIELRPDLYSQYLRYFKIDVNHIDLNFYDSLMINFLNLLLETNKLIFIDDVMQFIKPKDKVVIKQLINRLKKYNAVFLTGKEEYD